MKYFFLFVFFLLPMNFSFAGEVHYCSEGYVVGFDPKNSYEVGKYTTRRFKAYIDFDDKKIVSEEIYFKKTSINKCIYDGYNTTLYCLNDYGSAIAINKKTLKFHLSNIFNNGSNQRDEIYISHGTCEKF